MGADGHIAIYDWEKVKAYLESRRDKYQPKRKAIVFPISEADSAFAFADSVEGWVWGVYASGGVCGFLRRNSDLSPYAILRVEFMDASDKEPYPWPGYICDWECNGKQACLVYLGDNLFEDPFDNCEWLREWLDSSPDVTLVYDQEVWT